MAGGASRACSPNSKAGLEIGQAIERTTQSLPGGQHYFDIGGAPDLVMLWEGGTSLGRTRRAAFHLQGRLVLGQRLTVVPGLRADLFRGSTRAAKNIFSTTPVAPRLGVAWDVGANHQTVLRGSYGRYSDSAFAQAYLLTDDSEASDSVFVAVLAPGVFQELFRSTSPNRSIDPDIAHSHVDQLVAGGERQLGANWSLQTQYVYRRFDRFMMYTRSGAIWDPVKRRDPGPDGREATPDDGPAFTVYNLTNAAATTLRYENPDGLFRRYHALQAVARRRLADAWHAQSPTRGRRPRARRRTHYTAVPESERQASANPMARSTAPIGPCTIPPMKPRCSVAGRHDGSAASLSAASIAT